MCNVFLHLDDESYQYIVTLLLHYYMAVANVNSSLPAFSYALLRETFFG